VFWEKMPERPVGTPTVDTTALISPGVSVARMICSIRATVRSVSSTRVPTGARMRTMNWLSSEGGKNSVPMSGISAAALATRRRIAPMSCARWPRAQRSAAW
jgi:hypothetical protein